MKSPPWDFSKPQATDARGSGIVETDKHGVERYVKDDIVVGGIALIHYEDVLIPESSPLFRKD